MAKTGRKKLKSAASYFQRLNQANEFIGVQPIFYDRKKMWWMWNFDKFCYEQVDETDLLNGICSALNMDTTNGKVRTEILNALKQRGRENIPKPAKLTWVQFKDKIVDVKTGETIDANPEYFITNPIPWSIGKTEDTPTIDKLFRDWVVMEDVQDESYIDTMYEITAYSCLQDQFLQRLFALTGVGSNGKGCYTKLLKKFVGKDNTCVTELKVLTTKQFESSALYKKQIVFMTEVDSYDMQNSTLLKKLTGEDLIRYEFKGKTPFSEESGTTCIMATNSLPVTPDQSDAYYRRWLMVDYPRVFKVGKDVIGEIPDIEYNNLAKKVIRICKKLYDTNKFTNEGTLKERMERYEERSNPLMKFIGTEIIEDPLEYMVLRDFCAIFNEYLKKHRLRLMTTKKISKSLREEGFQVKGRKVPDNEGSETHTTCVFGLTLKIQEEEQAEKLENKPEEVDGFEEPEDLYVG